MRTIIHHAGLAALVVVVASSALRADEPFVWGVEAGSSRATEVTEQIVAEFATAVAESFVVSRVGSDFYEAHVAPDTSSLGVIWIRHRPPARDVCRVTLLFVPPCDTEQTLRMTVDVESSGGIRSSFGIPDCTALPKECAFAVGPEEALEIAERAGLEGSPSEWRAQLDWYDFGDHLTYAWRVYRPDAGAERTTTRRDIVIIDVNDGRVAGTEQE